MIIRKANIKDIGQLVQARKLQLQDEGQDPCVEIDDILYQYFHETLCSGKLVEWVAEDDSGRIIATAGVLFQDYPPAFTCPTGKKGYVTNMYTEVRFRRQGIAGKLLQKLEEEAKKRGVTRLILHASEMGRKAYAKNGYQETQTVMEKNI